MSVKITITRQPKNWYEDWKKESKRIEESREYISKVVRLMSNKAWTQAELDGVCIQKYGAYYVYDQESKACVECAHIEKKRTIRIMA